MFGRYIVFFHDFSCFQSFIFLTPKRSPEPAGHSVFRCLAAYSRPVLEMVESAGHPRMEAQKKQRGKLRWKWKSTTTMWKSKKWYVLAAIDFGFPQQIVRVFSAPAKFDL